MLGLAMKVYLFSRDVQIDHRGLELLMAEQK